MEHKKTKNNCSVEQPKEQKSDLKEESAEEIDQVSLFINYFHYVFKCEQLKLFLTG